MSDRELNDTVIRHLYEAASGLLPWPQALDGLYHELGARHVQLLTVDKTNGALVRSDQAASIDAHLCEAILEYVREYHQHDPHVLAGFSLYEMKGHNVSTGIHLRSR